MFALELGSVFTFLRHLLATPFVPALKLRNMQERLLTQGLQIRVTSQANRAEIKAKERIARPCTTGSIEPGGKT